MKQGMQKAEQKKFKCLECGQEVTATEQHTYEDCQKYKKAWECPICHKHYQRGGVEEHKKSHPNNQRAFNPNYSDSLRGETVKTGGKNEPR